MIMNKRFTLICIKLLAWLQDWLNGWWDSLDNIKVDLEVSLLPPRSKEDNIPMTAIMKDFYLEGLRQQLNSSMFELYHPEEKVSDKSNWGRSPIEHLIRAQINVNGGENDGNRGNRGNQSNTDIRENS